MTDVAPIATPTDDQFQSSNYVTPETLRAGDPQEREAVLYANPEGTFVISVWTAEPYTEHIDGYPGDEYIRVLEGAFTLTTDGGEPQHYGVGDELRIARGWSGTWEVTAPFRKLSVAHFPV
jgi:uncharacterized cupin superfamily protein